MRDRPYLMRQGIQGRSHLEPLPTCGRFDQQPFTTPDHPYNRGTHDRGGLHELDGSLPSPGFCSPWLPTIF